jgi:protein tyrosine phosphatase (PTP) superfamily phosphohydrolase (DUF442 family)
MRTLIASFLVLLAFPAAAERPDNFVQWRAGLASSGMPSHRWLSEAKELGYDTVIDLMPPHAHGQGERGILESKGVRYVNIPVDFSHPTAEDFRRFGEAMESNRGRNVLVHCMINQRGSSFAFLYRVINEGAPVRESQDKLLAVWVPDRVWRRFIEETLRANGKTADLM